MTEVLAARLRPFGTTVFARMSALAQQWSAVNLGQGFPDEDGPASVLDTAARAIRDGHNQYPPLTGAPDLRAAIAAHQRDHYGLDLDADSDVLVTMGATEALAATVLALCEPGDEVVTFEPYYDSYAAVVALAGATRRTIPLRWPDLAVTEDCVRAAFGPRTRLLLLNTPHNPSGKVFTAEELDLLARVAAEHDAWIVTDEVYEHLVYDGARHVPMATRPGARGRTLTISSAGKTFAVTGWKVGWVTGPAEAVAAVRTVKQFLTFSGAAPLQPAVAHGLGLGAEVFQAQAATLQRRREALVKILGSAGFTPHRPQGAYFVVADARPLGVRDAEEFCLRLPELCGVVAIPVSAFCDDPSVAEGLVRFAFCKRDDVIAEAGRRLARLPAALRADA